MPRPSPRLATHVVALLLACVAVSPVATARAADARVRDAIDHLPADIQSVQTCGTWRGGGDSGVHRVVLADADDGRGSELTVQWVRTATPDRPAAVVHSRAIRELADGHAVVSVRSVRCVTQGKGSALAIRGLLERDDPPRVHEWLLTLLPGGGYELKDTTR